MHRGVYVDHTGEPTWEQRAWAAVLFYAPAVLADESCLFAEGIRTGASGRPIHVAVDRARRVGSVPGVVVHRVTRLAAITRPSGSPPRLRLEDALVRVASRHPRSSAAVAVLGDACQDRRTRPDRLLAALERHPRLRGRAELQRVLLDAAQGAYSVLERSYLTRVERPHGLPVARRQRRVTVGRASTYRDVEYLAERVIVELEGRLGHELHADRGRDLARDLSAATAGDVTVRIGWRQVEDACRTAAAIATILRRRGWRGTLRACGPTCTADGGGLQAPGDRNPPTSDPDRAAGAG